MAFCCTVEALRQESDSFYEVNHPQKNIINMLIVIRLVSVGTLWDIRAGIRDSLWYEWSYNRGLSSDKSKGLFIVWMQLRRSYVSAKRGTVLKKSLLTCTDSAAWSPTWLLFCVNRWSSTAPSHPTWRSPRRRRSSVSGPTAGPTPCSDWASLRSSSWPRWEETSLQRHVKSGKAERTWTCSKTECDRAGFEHQREKMKQSDGFKRISDC